MENQNPLENNSPAENSAVPQPVQLTPEDKLAEVRKNGSSSLLLLAAVSALNMLLLCISDHFVPVTASVPYFIVTLSYYGLEVFGDVTTASVIGLLICGIFALCGLLSKKKPVWLLIGAVCYCVDTVLLLALNMYFFATLMPSGAIDIFEYACHGLIIFLLVHYWLDYRKSLAAVEEPHAGAQVLRSTDPENF